MKCIFFIIFIISTSKYLYSKDLFNTKFYDVDFISNNIDDDKIKKINQIKKISISKILNQTLQEDDYIQIYKLLSDDLINTFIKNIIINDEKIVNDKYKSKIKINFNKKKIINYFREKKIPYVEYYPSKFLLIIYEEDEINNNLFSKNNNFYQYLLENNQTNNIFILPKLDINDRFILKKDDIKNINIEKIKLFSKKYNLSDVVIVVAQIYKEDVNYQIFLYSDGVILEKKLNFKKYNFDEFFKILENETLNIWKKNNSIQHTSLNYLNCKLKYFNMLELKEIRKNLNNVSNIQNLTIKSLSYKYINYGIYYYGNKKLLYKIFELNKLKINVSDNLCTIKLI